jgi:dTDP-4-amino-4,6-dideoxygalactose transaminase
VTGVVRATAPIPFHVPDIGAGERDAVLEVLESGWLTSGERVVQFEEAIKQAVGARHAVAMNSATAAMHLGLEALGIGPADEVIVPTFTFAASGEVARYLGARPRLADVDPTTLNVSAETVADQLRPTTRAIMVVHFGGLIADMAPILELARERGIPVIEDAAHALPASRNGRAAGTFGDVGALSFYATKTVTTGEGGMLLTDDSAIADRARVMRLHGISRDAWKRYTASGSWFYEIEDVGYKYNLTDLAAAIGIVQLARAETMRLAREEVARLYGTAITDAGIGDLVELPTWPGNDVVHAWHLYPIRLRLERLAIDRATVIDELKAMGIGTSVHFIPLHLHPYYRRTYGYLANDLPVATREYAREISLPIYPSLGASRVTRVVDALATVLRPHPTTRW